MMSQVTAIFLAIYFEIKLKDHFCHLSTGEGAKMAFDFDFEKIVKKILQYSLKLCPYIQKRSKDFNYLLNKHYIYDMRVLWTEKSVLKSNAKLFIDTILYHKNL